MFWLSDQVDPKWIHFGGSFFFILFKISKWILPLSYLWLLSVQVKLKKKNPLIHYLWVNKRCFNIIKFVRFVILNFSTRNKSKVFFCIFNQDIPLCIATKALRVWQLPQNQNQNITTQWNNFPTLFTVLEHWSRIVGGHQFLLYEKYILSVLTTFTKTRVSDPCLVGTIGSGKQDSSRLVCPRLGCGLDFTFSRSLADPSAPGWIHR